jgi:hypothetical protein
MLLLLWILAVILIIAGIVQIIVGLLVGPGGVSVFDFDDDAAPVEAPLSG